MSKDTKTIVLLGASFVGLAVAHKLLKKTLNTATDYKLTIIAPNTHLYWNLAAPRAIVPGQLANDLIIQDIRPGFDQYGTKVQLIEGLASGLSTSTKTVTYIPTSTNLPMELTYDILIIATGSRPASPGPWKTPLGPLDGLVKQLHDIREDVKKAQTIVIGGGGPTGVETAGELAYEYGSEKAVTVITNGTQLISPTVPKATQLAAANELKKMKVEVIYSTKIDSYNKTADGKYELSLSNGEKKVVDLYIPTLGMINNTEWVTEKNLLNDKGEVIVDEFLRVKGADGVWAAGDAASGQANQVVYAQTQAAHVFKNLDLFIKGQPIVPYKAGPTTIAVTIGRGKGTGNLNAYKFPSFLIWLIKGRTLFIPNLKPLVEGNA